MVVTLHGDCCPRLAAGGKVAIPGLSPCGWRRSRAAPQSLGEELAEAVYWVRREEREAEQRVAGRPA